MALFAKTWNCNVCGAQNHENDGTCQFCTCKGADCKRNNCDGVHVSTKVSFDTVTGAAVVQVTRKDSIPIALYVDGRHVTTVEWRNA